MIKSDIKLKELIQLLNNEDDDLIIEGIEQLRLEVPFEGAIAQLSLFYDKSESPTIKKAIGLFMNDLKDQSAVNEVISEICKPLKPDTLRMLIASCWQSGLNYKNYTIDFARVFLRSDYATALECFTVIEDSVSEISDELRIEIIDLIKKSVKQQPDDKRVLTLELLSMLDI